MSKLNPAQEVAASHKDGPILVVAGAGAGKTKTLTERIARLIESGVPANAILAITFTNKAAREMRERVRARADLTYAEPFIGTFHSLGVSIIKENARALGVSRYFHILDEDESKTLIKESIVVAGFDPKELDPRRVRAVISKAKNNLLDPDNLDMSNEKLERSIGTVWQIYEKAKKKEEAFDFDDLLVVPLRLLENHKDVLEKYRNRWQYVHVDEYQDTNKVQYEMVKLLVGTRANLYVVGDHDQTIYSWRGADIKNIMRFERDYPNAKVVLLEENYRSTKTILHAANSVIQKNAMRVDKNLFTSNADGERITLMVSATGTHEAEAVAKIVKEKLMSGVKGEEIAVLYRTNFQSRAIEEGMIRAGIPYALLGTRFYERKEVKDVLAYIRAALSDGNPGDMKRIINVPPRGIGKASIAKLFAGDESGLPAKAREGIANLRALLVRIKKASNEMLPSELVRYVIKESGLFDLLSSGGEDDQERLLNIEELATIALSYDVLPPETRLEQLLDDAALAGEQDSLNQAKEDSVRLMTVHASKGLEFDTVIIPGLEAGLFPIEREGGKEDPEEERRLFYVAVTRAKKSLYLSYAMWRTIFGQTEATIPSQFLMDIPEHLMQGYAESTDDTVIDIDL